MTPWKKYLVKKDSDAQLSAHDPDETGDFPDKEHALPQLRLQLEKLTRLQDVLYAESKHALLIVLQAIDAGGKDGTIRHVFRGMNPQGCSATAFKVPTQEELRHDCLWRVHQKVPQLGMIGIFNRSHYEEALVVRVHQHLSKKKLKQRFREFNDFEQLLTESGTTILKFFLHISREEQRRRRILQQQSAEQAEGAAGERAPRAASAEAVAGLPEDAAPRSAAHELEAGSDDEEPDFFESDDAESDEDSVEADELEADDTESGDAHDEESRLPERGEG